MYSTAVRCHHLDKLKVASLLHNTQFHKPVSLISSSATEILIKYKHNKGLLVVNYELD